MLIQISGDKERIKNEVQRRAKRKSRESEERRIEGVERKMEEGEKGNRGMGMRKKELLEKGE